MKNFSKIFFIIFASTCFSAVFLFAQAEKFSKSSHTFNGRTIPYQLFVPDTLEAGVNYPLILALHGASRRGDDNTHVEISPYLWTWAQDEIQQDHPSFVLVPQCPEKRFWYNVFYIVGDIIDSLITTYPVDSTRLYVTGYSMGGYGSWDYAFKYPLRFAAAVPCAGTTTWIKNILKDNSDVTPMWVFNSDSDDEEPVLNTREVIDSMLVNGVEVIKTTGFNDDELDSILATNPTHLYTEYHNVSHGQIDDLVFFDNPRLITWLFNQQAPEHPLPDPVYPTDTPVQLSEPPVNFSFISQQPVFSYGSPGSWDDGGVQAPAVIQDGDTLRMWYIGFGSISPLASIGYAWSLDGMTWHRSAENPVLSPTFLWEGTAIAPRCVIKENNEYKMWYVANLSGNVIGYATSIDGVIWTKHPTPILLPGGINDWDYLNIFPHSVIKDSDQYLMWYDGGNTPTHYQIGLATSSDGIIWTKYNDELTNENPYGNSDPVVSFRSSWGDWNGVSNPTLIKNEDGYQMLYVGSNRYEDAVYYAHSDDGINWTKYVNFPVFDQTPPWTESPHFNSGSFLESSDGRLLYWYACPVFDRPYYYLIKPQIGYAIDLKGLPYVHSLELDHTFIRAGIDTVQIKTQIDNSIGHEINVQAKFYTDNNPAGEYVLLYDDGEHGDSLDQDDIYAGYWIAPEENTFHCIVEIQDITNGYTYNSLIPYSLEELITTIGPIEVSYSEIPMITPIGFSLKLHLKNYSTQVMAPSVNARISTSDTNISNIQNNNISFGNIAADETKTNESQSFNIFTIIHPDCTGIIPFYVHISSNGFEFWEDTIEVDVIAAGLNDWKVNIPHEFALGQNYPNPFNPNTIINYELPITNEVEISIYNLLGQKVAKLVSKKQNAGYHQVEWDASGFASGIYYYRIQAGEFQNVKKMVLLR
jgi:pimeloyl-ACP methyl ester carboxylesterase